MIIRDLDIHVCIGQLEQVFSLNKQDQQVIIYNYGKLQLIYMKALHNFGEVYY